MQVDGCHGELGIGGHVESTRGGLLHPLAWVSMSVLAGSSPWAAGAGGMLGGGL